ncbi:acetyl-CoA synthetase-like protein [Neoconidiobolus thromboides FSU 785]|nr:acetyl-CoA synthetase-like protein [Neoconidiobolus thromboides FSU 785]
MVVKTLTVKEGLKLDQLCVEVPNSRKSGQTGIFRTGDYKEELVAYREGEPRTFYEFTQYAFKAYGKQNCFGTRNKDPQTGVFGPYEWITYSEVEKLTSDLSSGLVYLYKNECKLDDLKGKTVGLFSANRTEWVITDFALISQSLINVALFDTYGQETLEYVINHSQVPLIVCSQERIPKLLKSAPNLPGLKVIISMDPFSNNKDEASSSNILKSWAASCNIKLLDFNEVLAIGKQNPVVANPPLPEDIYTYCYTSGTTGQPKGAIITHANNSSAALGAYQRAGIPRGEEDVVYMSFLPLPHCFERCSLYAFLYTGASIGFYCGDITKLMDDCAVLKPTAMNSVPRLLNRIYDAIAAKGLHGQGLGPALFRIAYQKKLQYYKEGNGVEHPIWDPLVFNKVRQVLGGRLKFMLTGSAPLSPKVMEFLRVCLSLDICEGFGTTETCAASLLTVRGDNEAGAVGPPLFCNEFKLVDVPSMNYLSTDKPFARGELCIRGYNIFKGYLNEPEKTKEAIDEEGWFHTGDIATLNRHRFPVIIDRIKNIFKLSQGEYISPEKIENIYATTKYIAQAFVYGDSFQSKLVAVIVPDAENFPEWAKSIVGGSEQLSIEQLCQHPKVNEALLKEIKNIETRTKLAGFEKVFGIFVEHEPFSIENNLITPTFKLKRHDLKSKYQKHIDELYQKINNE